MKKAILKLTSLLCAAVMLVTSGTGSMTAFAEEYFSATGSKDIDPANYLSMPSDKVINAAVQRAVKSGNAYIAYRKDCSYSVVDKEKAEKDMFYSAVAAMLNKSCYEEMGGAGYYGSYEEYKDSLLSAAGVKSESELKVEPYFVFAFTYTAPRGEKMLVTNEKAAEKALRRTFELQRENRDFKSAISDVFRLKIVGGVYVNCNYNGKSEETLEIKPAEPTFVITETLKLSSASGFYIYNTFVPKNTKKLVISSRDADTVKFLTDFIPDDCVWACRDETVDFDDCVFDMKEIQKALPNLKELYMYQARVKNEKYIAKMTNLQALSYYPLSPDENYSRFIEKPVIKTPPYKNLKNLKKLWMYGEYSDYSFLEKMTSLKSVYAELRDAKAASSLFGSKRVNKLYIQCEKLDMTGIKNMTGLKELEIDSSVCVDAKAVAGINNLRKLKISCSGTYDLSALANCAKLTDLSLNGAEAKDWGFLKKLKNLKTLFLGYVKVHDSDIRGLNVTEITLYDTRNTYAVLSELPKLESAAVMELSGWVDAFKGSKTLKSYAEIFGRGGDYKVLAKCPNLETITLLGCRGKFDANDFVKCKKLTGIYFNGTRILNGEKLGKIKTLKNIMLHYNGVDMKLGFKLKEALPECEIDVDQTQVYNN
ncbi:MAG: hypothetical protein IJT87_07550 [Ruminiclostridium sp.]|nr:hypothetical protein [Ruminiclostridium sp.]